MIASNNEDILSEICDDFKADITNKPFDWKDQSYRILAILINVGVEESGQLSLNAEDLYAPLEEIIKACKSSEKDEKDILERTLNLISKLTRKTIAAENFLESKHVVFKLMLYFNKQFGDEIQLNSLRTLFSMMKLPNFRSTCFDDHKFTMSIFQTFIKEAMDLFTTSYKQNNFANVTLACSVISNFLDHFSDKTEDFKPIVIDVISIVKDKSESVR
jgi:hypothetical protein